MRIAALFITFLYLFACQTVIKIDLPEEPDRIVVNSLVSADSTWLFRVTSSANPVATSSNKNEFVYKAIQDAQVTLTDEDGNNYAVTYIDKIPNGLDCSIYNCEIYRYYTSSTSIKAEKDYTLEVAANGFSTVKSKFSVPYRVPIEASEFGELRNVNGDAYNNPSIKGSISFRDNPTEKNHYLLEVYSYQLEYDYDYDFDTDELTVDSFYIYEYTYLTSPDPSVVNSGPDNIGSFLLINDTFLSSNLVKLNFTAEISSRFYNDMLATKSEELIVFLKHISEDYYNYLLSYENYSFTEENLLAEPVQVTSNVENGFGIIAAYASDTVGYKIKQ